MGGTIAIWLAAACCSAACLLAGRQLIHWFQLESYQFPGYFRTLRRQGIRAWIPGLLLSGTALGLIYLNQLLKQMASFWPRMALCALILLASGMAGRWFGRKHKEKKKLVFTPRVKRLYAVCFIVWTLIHYLILTMYRADWFAPGSLLFPAAFLLLPAEVALGGLLAWPIEKAISEMYFRDAQRILREHSDLIRIGITGSWGKTSVKFILGTLLSERYPTLVTPASFNTPMGVTKVIRSRLEPGHRVFVAEMGARHVGDIREMCRLVHPQLGILTSVGPQHLDTFHTQERITKTKYELIDAIPENGECFFADDDGIVLDLWRKTGKNKTLTGMNSDRDDVWADNLRVSAEGSEFDLCFRDGQFHCKTELLGELNIRNIILCAGVCRKLGMTGLEIVHGIRKLKPVEHRLELKHNPGGLHILDDAFNSNIRGAEQAFRVLRDFPGRHIVVTPGMVELGSRETELNREFGAMMADCCDDAILVGRKRSESIRSGLIEAGFPEQHIHVAENLDKAISMMNTLVTPGDSVLFENDLPDNYSEE